MYRAIPLITIIVDDFALASIPGMLTNKLHTSPLVGHLLADVLAGPLTPGLVADTKFMPELAELGVILLMSGVGSYFSFEDLMAVKSTVVLDATAQIAVVTLLGMVFSAALGQSLITGIVLDLCLSTANIVMLPRASEEQ